MSQVKRISDLSVCRDKQANRGQFETLSQQSKITMKPKFSDYFLYGTGACLLGTLLGSSLLSLLWLFQQNELSVAQWAGETAAISFYGFIIALPIVAIYGVPLYSLIAKFGWASWWSVLSFGALPGLLWVMWTHSPIADPILFNGICISGLFHRFMARFLATQQTVGS